MREEAVPEKAAMGTGNTLSRPLPEQDVINHQCHKHGWVSAGLCDTDRNLKWGEHPAPVVPKIPIDPFKKAQTENLKPVAVVL